MPWWQVYWGGHRGCKLVSMLGDTSTDSGADAKPDASTDTCANSAADAGPNGSAHAQPHAANVSGRDIHCGFWVLELRGWQVLSSGS